MRGYFRTTELSEDKSLLSYVIGVSIGDGNLSNPNGRATRLRVTCDKKYPELIENIKKSLSALFPQNRVGVVDRENCVDVSICSNHLESLLGWKVGCGPKHIQKVSIPDWIKEKDEYKIKCLKGLIETDGSIYLDRGYKMVIFSTIIPNLAQDVNEMIISLGFKPNVYKISEKNQNKKAKYQIRLSKDTDKFLKLIKPNKS